jgi:hypothetical protein
MAFTISNQFAWNALRGARKRDLAVSFLKLYPMIFGCLEAVPRAVAAVIVPLRILEWRVLSSARRFATANLRQARYRQRVKWKRQGAFD